MLLSMEHMNVLRDNVPLITFLDFTRDVTSLSSTNRHESGI